MYLPLYEQETLTMETDFSDYSTYGIHNFAVRHLWAGFTILTILSAQLGGIIILISTIKYNAIRLHRFTVTIIQHIAVCDMISSLVLTTFLVSLLADGNVLGNFICHARAYLALYSFPASLHLMAALTTSKYLLLKFPLNDSIWSRRRARGVCAVIWIYSSIFPLSLILSDRQDIGFDYRDYACRYNFSSRLWRTARPIVAVFLCVVPSLIVPTTTALLIVEARKVARRHRDNLRWQGLVTVIFTALVFAVSVAPISFYSVLSYVVMDELSEIGQVIFYRFAVSCFSINVMYNFYLYCLTVKSFRKFLVSRGKTLFWKGKLSIFDLFSFPYHISTTTISDPISIQNFVMTREINDFISDKKTGSVSRGQMSETRLTGTM